MFNWFMMLICGAGSGAMATFAIAMPEVGGLFISLSGILLLAALFYGWLIARRS